MLDRENIPARKQGFRWIVCLIACLLPSLNPNFGTAQTPTPTPKSRAVRKQTVPPASPEQILEARALLGALGYWVTPDLDRPDDSLYHALIAFQKVEGRIGRERPGRLTAEELAALRTARPAPARESGPAHIEVDLTRQILLVVDSCGAVLKILPISSGSGELFTEGGRTRRACTPCGRFKVQWKISGWRRSPLGLLYYPSYIYNGVAIHGNPSVPPEPASHGCIRVPMFAAKELFEMMPVGMDVIVYGESETASASIRATARAWCPN